MQSLCQVQRLVLILGTLVSTTHGDDIELAVFPSVSIVTLGKHVIFHCNSSVPVSLSWRRRLTGYRFLNDIHSTDRFTITTGRQYSQLVVSMVEPRDAGQYICILDKHHKTTANLAVISSSPWCNTDLMTGDDGMVELSCEVVYSNNLVVSFSWTDGRGHQVVSTRREMNRTNSATTSKSWIKVESDSSYTFTANYQHNATSVNKSSGHGKSVDYTLYLSCSSSSTTDARLIFLKPNPKHKLYS